VGWTTATQRDLRLQDRLMRAGDPLTIFWQTDLHLSALDGEHDDPAAIRGALHLYSGTVKARRFVDEANIARPDLAVHTGDMVDTGPTMFPTFMTEWARLAVPSALTLGNHDLYGVTFAEATTALGRDPFPEVAGSRFNESFGVTNGNVAARILMVDTNRGDAGAAADTTGRLQSDAIAWIEAEMDAASEDIVLLFSHHGPHGFAGPGGVQFSETDATAVAAAIQGVLDDRPAMRAHWLFGHAHGTQSVLRQQTLGVGIPGYRAAAIIDRNPGAYLVVRVTESGDARFARRQVLYP
jgi:3',5'-cyclic AMP phosphodiesterase CpdA